MSLEQDSEARRLTVTLEGRRRKVGLTRASGGLALGYQKETVYLCQVLLDGERVYRDGLSWPFEVLVPELPGAEAPFPVEWAVTALLERPASTNEKAVVGITVAPRPTRAPARTRPGRRRAPGGR